MSLTELIVPKKSKEKIRESIFRILINTNKSLNSKKLIVLQRLPEIKKKMIELLSSLFSQRNLIKILEVGNYANYEKRLAETSDIINISAHSQLESNLEGNGLLHSHTIIKVQHSTKILVNIKLLKKIVYKYLADVLTFNGKFSKPFVSVQGMKNDAFSVENYVKEGVEIINLD